VAAAGWQADSSKARRTSKIKNLLMYFMIICSFSPYIVILILGTDFH